MLAVGGSTRAGSTTESALRIAADGATAAGANVRFVTGPDLLMPMYDGRAVDVDPARARLVEGVRWAHGLLVASPGYHGAVSGLVKNALDHIEDLRLGPDGSPTDTPYLEGIGVGCIAVAQGWQAGVSTLHQLRTIVHALRGWPTPLGVVVNTGQDTVEASSDVLRMVGAQVVEFALMRRALHPGEWP